MRTMPGQATATHSIACPVCHARRTLPASACTLERITITCSARCHSIWRATLKALLLGFPALARKPDAIGYYAKREYVPEDVIETYYETMRKHDGTA